MRITLLLLLAIGFQSHGLESACYPNLTKHPEAKNWPICAIYLHGLHPSNDRGRYTRYEEANRPIIEEFSDDNLLNRHCRIAAPAAPDGREVRRKHYSRSGRAYYRSEFVRAKYRDWQHRSLKEVETAAQKACGGAALQKGRALIGFSAGGWEAYHLANDNCSTLADYGRVVAIGLPELGKKNQTYNSGCKGAEPKFSLLKTHDFPSQFSQSVQRAIAASLPSAYNVSNVAPDVSGAIKDSAN